ncbi:MAG TPA: hypothetical protein PK581_08385 [Caldisericia bacterium]|nr:hypothetical protein [Caldisericia bacterium]
MKKQNLKWINAGIVGLISFLIIGILIYTWNLLLPSYSDYFQVNAQYFPFFIAHLTPLWVLIHALYLLSVSSRFLFRRIKPLLFWSLVLLCLQIPFWPIFGLVKYYYHFGQQSSWFRLFNVHNQMYLSTYWLSAYLIPLLLLLFVFLFIAYKSLGKKGDAPNKTIPLWLLALSSSLALLLLWGMALSYRDAYLLSQAQALGGIKNQFHWIAIYNPLSALVALGKAIFQSPAIVADLTSTQHVAFVRPNFTAGTWPGFFNGFFYVKMLIMLLFTSLSLWYGFLIHRQDT